MSISNSVVSLELSRQLSSLNLKNQVFFVYIQYKGKTHTWFQLRPIEHLIDGLVFYPAYFGCDILNLLPGIIPSSNHSNEYDLEVQKIDGCYVISYKDCASNILTAVDDENLSNAAAKMLLNLITAKLIKDIT